MGGPIQDALAERARLGIVTQAKKKLTIAFAMPVAEVMYEGCEREGVGPTEFLRRLLVWYASDPEGYDAFYERATRMLDALTERGYEMFSEASRARYGPPPPATRDQAAHWLAKDVAALFPKSPSMFETIGDDEGGIPIACRDEVVS